MLVKDTMSTNLITIEPTIKIFDAVDLMRQHEIHRLPVVENNRLIGLLTEGTIQEAMPSKATSLSVYEMNYLLNKTTAADVMITDVATISETCLLEDAIYQMRTNNVGVLPVINEQKDLVGIITNNDIFDAFLELTGYYEAGTRIAIKIENDHNGVLAKVTAILAEHDISIIQVVVYRKNQAPTIVFQTTATDETALRQLIESHGYVVESSFETSHKNR
ncbi:hypothetical protein CBF34_04600 [Vagococcus penaei]|uniref:Uncharacterized protein n=1 Tax=Vagococcus penaei TaxID=633807 RepID=A0A1Q2D4I2_9ENTE|nr:CBS and ACT domain-containing protein [Vagococcus penaei]AQP53306.1 hypothetical protein BW732_03025 [Vagococcus penaei]RSU04076.1 hypothetical protein CBF34_04600 [Vagococcus penaei]